MIAAIGLGGLFQVRCRWEDGPVSDVFDVRFQVPVVALQAAMPLKDMATTTSTFGFIR